MKIAILGAGVGGLSAAIALKKKGFDIEIYEKHSNINELGAGIVCWPNASFVLDKLGILDGVKKVSGEPTEMRRLTDKGETIGSLNLLKLNETMGYPSYSILRRDLMNILGEHAKKLGIEIRYNAEVKSMTTRPDNLAQAHLKNGQVIEADVFMGADGRMNSVARQYVLGNNKPVYQGFINWVGVCECSKEIFSEMTVCDYWGVGERFGIVPVSPRKAYWAGAIASVTLAEKNPEIYKAELLSIFKHWPAPIQMMIEETALSKMNKIYVHDHDPIKRWHRNNVLLMGDAAHAPLPTSGQGACQALEDAWHLAQSLENNMTDINKAFHAFTSARSDKTAGITLGARKLASSLFNTDAAFCLERNLNSKMMNYDDMVTGMANAWASGLGMHKHATH